MSVTVTRILSPEDWKSRQVNTLKSVGEANYKTGIMRPSKDPIAAGIAAEEKYANQTKKAIDEKRRATQLGKTDMAQWYKYSSELGAGRLVDGVVKREAKVTDAIRNLQPQVASIAARIDALPEATEGEREQRVLENLRAFRALKGKV